MVYIYILWYIFTSNGIYLHLMVYIYILWYIYIYISKCKFMSKKTNNKREANKTNKQKQNISYYCAQHLSV